MKIEELNKKIEENKQARLEEQELRPIKNLEEGDNEVTVDVYSDIRETETKFGKRYVIDTEDGEALMMSEILAENIVPLIYKVKASGLSRLATLRINRNGRGKETRYNVELVEDGV